MEILDIQDADIKNSDLNKKLYKKFSKLSEQKDEFENFIKEIQGISLLEQESGRDQERVKRSSNHQKMMSQQFQQSQSEGQDQPEYGSDGQRIEKEKKSSANPFKYFISQMLDKAETLLVDSNKEDNKLDYLIQDLDDKLVTINDFQLQDGKVFYNDKHNNLQNILFVSSGFMTEECKANDNFKSFNKNKKKTDSPNNLILNFRWESSCVSDLAQKLVTDMKDQYVKGKEDLDQVIKFFTSLLTQTMESSGASELYKNTVYFIIRGVILFIKTPILVGYTEFFLDLLLDLLNSIINNFIEAYHNAKLSGKFLASFIVELANKFPNLQFDLMGHSLGTVIVHSTLSNLSDKHKIRYIILMGGVATIPEILSCSQIFSKCFNFFSFKDQVLNQLLVSGDILGQGNKYVGLNFINGQDKGRFISKQLNIGHTEYSKSYDEYHDLAMLAFTHEVKFIKEFIPTQPSSKQYEEDKLSSNLDIAMQLLSPFSLFSVISASIKMWKNRSKDELADMNKSIIS